MTRNEIVEAFVAHCGIERHNEFLNVLRTTSTEKGRLLFWQEKLWREFANQHGLDADLSLNHMIELFADDQPRTIHYTKDEFLADPNRLWYKPDASFQLEWAAEAWQDPAFRDNLSYELARSVSKTGDFELCGRTLDALSKILTNDQAVNLYVYIRDQSMRPESEWRDAFIQAFPKTRDLLPAPQGRAS